MKSKLYIIFGAPGCGKSTTVEYLQSFSDSHFKIIAKETTRLKRYTDKDEIIIVGGISDECDIRYTLYGVEYGAVSQQIWDNFAKKKSSVIIVNDIRTIKILKQKFGALAKVIYIHSNTDKESFSTLLAKRYPDLNSDDFSRELHLRIKKMSTIYRKYIENTALFDYTILNTDSLKNLYIQIDNIINDQARPKPKMKTSARVFIIAGAVLSGKEELVNAMVQMEKKRILNYMKATDRKAVYGDKGELRHMDTVDKKVFNIQYEKQSHVYGISTQEIWKQLSDEKMILLVVSDSEAIQSLLDEFGDLCIVVYLHANKDIEEIESSLSKRGLPEEEIDKRLHGIIELRDMYVKKINLFDHVLINSSEPEDLYDQAFNILDSFSE